MNPFLEELHQQQHLDNIAEQPDAKRKSFWSTSWSSRTVIVIVIYVSLLLDNVLLTVIGE